MFIRLVQATLLVVESLSRFVFGSGSGVKRIKKSTLTAHMNWEPIFTDMMDFRVLIVTAYTTRYNPERLLISPHE